MPSAAWSEAIDCTGPITPIAGEGNPEVLDFIAGLHPVKWMAKPVEIARAALFLCRTGRDS